MTTDPLAHVRIGDDPDPTLDVSMARACPAVSMPGGWLCTRERDHPGQHIAGAVLDVAHVWPQEASR